MRPIKLIFLFILILIFALPSLARNFTYNGLTYTVIDEIAKTCKTREGQRYSATGNTYVGNLVIPATALDGTVQYTVVEIGKYGFSNNEGLSSVSFPESLTTIGEYAFYECTSLSSVSFPGSLTKIEYCAFYGCTSLSSVNLPASLTKIEPRAFYGCTSLSSVRFSGSLTTIEQYAFYGCTSLSLVKFPDSLTTIGAYAFYGCTSLSSLNLPNSLTRIEQYAFYGCTSLSSLNLPNSLTRIEPRAFNRCISLSSVSFPDSLTTIGDYAFSVCISLSSVSFPDSLTTIGDYAFNECFSLSSVSFPDSLTTIGDYAFYGCTSLSSVSFPDSLTTIGDYAFYGCTSLSSVSFPDSLTTIGDYAFYECTSLSSVSFPDALTTIGDYAFNECTSLSSVSFPDSLTTIGDYAFYGCTSLSSVSFPDSLTTIRDYAFYGCTSLSSVSFPESLIYIGDYGFSRCSVITSVTCIGTSVPILPTYNFIFESEVYANSILNVPNVSLAKVQATTPWNRFSRIRAKDGAEPEIVVGQEFEYNGVIYTITDLFSCCTKAGNSAEAGNIFNNDNALALPESASDGTYEYSVTGVGAYGFRGCKHLQSVTLPASIVSVGEEAFGECERLTSIVWQSAKPMERSVVESIGNPNLLIYVTKASYAPEGMDHNVIVPTGENGPWECKSLILEPGYPFGAVKDFTSLQSSLTKRFSQYTPIDGCAGWETLVLPFDVTSVRASQGELTAFAAVNNPDTQRPYWLYEADGGGDWKAASSIRAGIPYIISMPNNPEYNYRYRVSGPVTFSSDTATLITHSVTSPYRVSWENTGNEFRSLWLPLDDTEGVLGLNVGMSELTDEEGVLLAPGSAFCAGITPRPFEAYVRTSGNIPVLRIRSGAQSGRALMTVDSDLDIIAEDGSLTLLSAVERTVNVYRIDGVIVATVNLRGGERYLIDGLERGLYIVAGRKIVI